jgi:endoglucanase
MKSFNLFIASSLCFTIFASCKKASNTGTDASTTTDNTTTTTTTTTVTGTPVQRYGQLAVAGQFLKSKDNNTITLRGQSFGWSSYWPQYWNANVVNWLADDFKVDIVRASMGVDVSPGGYLNDQANQLSNLKAVVDGAVAKGIYVIIDWHCEALHQPEAVAFFTAMAKQYANTPNVLYEIINEPNNTSTWPQVKSYAEAVVAAIRQYDTKNIIIVGCPYWDQKIRDVADSPLTGYSNIMYTVHYYAATHGQYLRDDCAYAINKNLPIFVTESNGSEASGSGHIDYTQWEAWFTFLEANHISWINWSVSDKPGELCSILQPGAPSNGGWTSAQLTETGNYIRAKLRSFSK